MHRYKCLSCDIRTKSNKLYKDHINPICKHEKCNKPANYRKLKVVNCTLKNTYFEYCSFHRPKNSVNMLLKTFEFKYYNVTLFINNLNHENKYLNKIRYSGRHY